MERMWFNDLLGHILDEINLKHRRGVKKIVHRKLLSAASSLELYLYLHYAYHGHEVQLRMARHSAQTPEKWGISALYLDLKWLRLFWLLRLPRQKQIRYYENRSLSGGRGSVGVECASPRDWKCFPWALRRSFSRLRRKGHLGPLKTTCGAWDLAQNVNLDVGERRDEFWDMF